MVLEQGRHERNVDPPWRKTPSRSSEGAECTCPKQRSYQSSRHQKVNMHDNDATKRQKLLEEAKKQTISPQVLSQIEAALRFPRNQLNSVESQQRYIVEEHLQMRECPWCDSLVSYFETIPETFEYKLGYGCDCLRCPACKKNVVQQIPFIGTWSWGKREEDKDPNRRRRRAV